MIDLPLTPAPQSAEAALASFGVMLQPPLGGPVQRVNRHGSKWRLSVTMPPMQGANARKWKARLTRGLDEGVRMEFPLLDFEPGPAGSPLADGATASGASVPIKGVTPGYTFREGQFVSVISGGIYHLHQVQAEASAGSGGTVTLILHPNLRRAVANNDAVSVKPMIEGFLQGDELRWTMALGNFQGFSFEIHEAE